MKRLFIALALFVVFAATGMLSAQEPWATYRGNSQRTGCTDGQPVSLGAGSSRC